ncbi:hypothetical protein T492DRAFT_839689 [Pavlovales sp. CCMP2436]|nr:hypothetical protein T492DRAFT_839689 [Pavlovales sp. CCMP2436]
MYPQPPPTPTPLSQTSYASGTAEEIDYISDVDKRLSSWSVQTGVLLMMLSPPDATNAVTVDDDDKGDEAISDKELQPSASGGGTGAGWKLVRSLASVARVLPWNGQGPPPVDAVPVEWLRRARRNGERRRGKQGMMMSNAFPAMIGHDPYFDLSAAAQNEVLEGMYALVAEANSETLEKKGREAKAAHIGADTVGGMRRRHAFDRQAGLPDAVDDQVDPSLAGGAPMAELGAEVPL